MLTLLSSNYLKRRGYTFSAGSGCTCNDIWYKHYPNKLGTIVIEKTKCKNGQKHKTCPTMITLYRSGNVVAQLHDTGVAQKVDEFLKRYGLLAADKEVYSIG